MQRKMQIFFCKFDCLKKINDGGLVMVAEDTISSVSVPYNLQYSRDTEPRECFICLTSENNLDGRGGGLGFRGTAGNGPIFLFLI